MEAKSHLNFEFEVKKKGSDIYIEGYSNAATVDRIKEKIDPMGWNLENYKKNPVVLFDHGKDPAFGTMPIGKAIMVEAKPDGLHTKIQLSSSKTEKITAIRDLVSEGILKTFSVGFNPMDSQKDGNNPDVTVIKSAELIEQSIVPVPMNQDSVFGVLSKRFASQNPVARKWFDFHTAKLRLVKKGAWVAAALHQQMYNLMETGEIADRDATIKAIAAEAGTTTGDLKSVLSGDVTPVPDKTLAAFAKMLRLDKDFLVNLDNGDLALIERMQERAQQEQSQGGGKAMAARKTKNDKAPPPPADQTQQPDSQQPPAQPVASKPEYVVQKILIPKTVATSEDMAMQMCQDHGFACDSLTDEGDNWAMEQAPADGLDMSKQVMIDMGDGIMAVAAPETASDNEQGEDSEGKSEKAGLAPDPKMSNDELHALQKQRASKYGIEVVDGSSLTFPSDGPTSLDQYADPVNLKFPIDDAAHAANARVRFKQFAESYKQDSSKAKVHERIVRAELSFGATPSFDPKDPLDAMLPSDLKDKLQKPAGKANPPQSQQPTDGSSDQPVDVAAAKEAYAQYEKEREATNNGTAGNPAAWIADEAKWEKAKEMAKAAGATDIYPFAVWAYLNVLGGTKKSGEAAVTKDIGMTDDNPYIELSRQTNVLLGTLINEIQKMSEKLNGLADVSLKLAEVSGTSAQTPAPQDTGKGGVDFVARFRKDFSDIDSKLKRLGV